MTDSFPDKIPTDCAKKALKHCVRSFTAHPAQVDETYWQHLRFTVGMALRLTFTGIVLLVHGLLPFMFCRTGSEQCERIYRILQERKKS